MLALLARRSDGLGDSLAGIGFVLAAAIGWAIGSVPSTSCHAVAATTGSVNFRFLR